MGRKMVTRLLPLFGFLFLTAYVRSASADIVYSDYIRLVNTYLEDVWSFRPYMHGDILTRIPANYPQRILNVVLFRYSTMFDMMLGAFFLAVSAWVAGRYCERKQLPVILTALVLGFIFSLNKWEMLTNGSGWIHFAAFALFWYHYLVWDRYQAGEGKRGDRWRLLLLPWIIILFFSGPYCGVYAVTMLIAEGFAVLAMKKPVKPALQRAFCIAAPLVLYLISRALSVEERAGATTDPIGTVVRTHPTLLPSFFVRSFSSMLIGGETAEFLGLGRTVTLLLGILVLALYVLAFYINFREGLYRTTTMPLCLLTSGFLNHVLVTAARWIFLNDAYGMSSRYALQYQVGIIGIMLTFLLTGNGAGELTEASAGELTKTGGETAAEAVLRKRARRRRAAAVIVLVFSLGSGITTAREIHMAPYRQEHFIAMQQAAREYRTRTDKELTQALQYHDADRIRKALGILERQGLNIYREQN